MKQYKFQALVRLYTDGDGKPLTALGTAPRRVVLRGRNEEDGRSQVYNALVSALSAAPAYSSAARQQHQAATER